MTIRKPDMVGDELGDPADNPHIDESGEYNPTRYFGYGITIPDRPNELAAIRVRLGEFPDLKPMAGKKVKEIKTRRLPRKYKTWLAKKIGRNSQTYAYVVNKTGELPRGWKGYSSSERIVALVIYSIRETIQKVPTDDVFILFDQHSALQTPWAKRFISDYLEELGAEFGKRIYFDTAKSSAGPFSDEMQMADVAPNFVFEELEHRRRFWRKKAGVKVVMLDEDDSIIIEGLSGFQETYETLENKNRRGAVIPPKRDIYAIVEVL